MANKILITGFSGFVGAKLAQMLVDKELVLLGRHEPDISIHPFYHYEFDVPGRCDEAVKDVNVVIHCAARVHMMDDKSSDPLAVFRQINTLGTQNLAKQAAAAGVKRFIFLSSIKVNGESTTTGRPFKFDDSTNPQDAYGISKNDAEIGLKEIAAETGMEVVIIRPPLVYGSGVKANFAAMLGMAQRNLPLPLGAIANKRSLVALDNLVDLIITCVDHPKAANQTFLVSDDQDVSTTELLQMMTRAVGKRPRLIPVPVSWLRFIAKIAGKQAIIDRLCGNLQVDITHTKETLGWKPPVTVEEGIKRCFVKEELC